MNKILFILTALTVIWSCTTNGGTDSLEQGFITPPDEARPGVYWYFMDGNLSADGMTKDLEAMRKAGIGHVLFLEVGIGIPRGKVDFLSEEWQTLFAHAVHECERLGIRMVLGIGPGWNGSGGPWVEGEQAMQHLVYTSVDVAGGKGEQSLILPKPAPRKPFFGEGVFSDAPETLERWKNYYDDVAVLAFPAGATRIDTAVVSGSGYFRIPEIDERALYYRKPYSSVVGVPQYIPMYQYLKPQPKDSPVGKDKIIDLTASLQDDGSLKWDAPAGQWTVMRFGARSSGSVTRPAPVPGLGFEADKLDTAAMISHFANFTGKLFDRIGFTKATPAGGGIKSLHIDSWEMGAQNWTKHFRENFIKRRGYDPLPYFPVYAGVMVGSREISERFLWDLRQTVQDMVVDYHVSFVRRYAHQHGLDVSIEPYDMNPTADMELAAAADVPMAEFWGGTSEFDYYGYNTSWSATEASSVAHLKGQAVVPAESFTAAFDAWRQHPASIKNQGDWAFAAGVNRLMYHTFQHQALPDSLRPGMTMGIYGLHWDRNQTWWYLSDAYHRYVARCQYMLQQGRTVADVLYLAPEGAPHVFRAPASAFSGEEYFPDKRGYNFDACPPSMLMQAQVVNGNVSFPSGATYRLLALPCIETMRPELLSKIAQLINDGATVIGLPPVQSPSLTDYPACDNEVQRLSTEVWGDTESLPVELQTRTVGKGKIIFGEILRTEADNLYPKYDLTASILQKTLPPDIETDGEIRYMHRTIPSVDVSSDNVNSALSKDINGVEIYFLANRIDKSHDSKVTFRVSGLQPELWNPNTGERRALPDYAELNGRTAILLHFEPYESYFIVYRQPGAQKPSSESNFKTFTTLLTLDKPWDVSFDPKWGGPEHTVFESLSDWSANADPAIRFYSGTAFYRQTFELSDVKGKELFLNLGRVKNIARITLNGKDMGVVWTSPWQIDITRAARSGRNELTVEVVNLWANRLIGDEIAKSTGEKTFTYATQRHYRKDSRLLESGLTGPVKIEIGN